MTKRDEAREIKTMDDEIRSALDFIKSARCDDTPNQDKLYAASQVLIHLAEQYLAMRAEGPKEKDGIIEEDITEPANYQKGKMEGYNAGLHAATLSFMKRCDKQKLKKIVDKFCNGYIDPHANYSPINAEGMVDTIHNMLRGKK